MGPRLLHHMLYQRATMQGILARDYVHRMDEMTRIVAPWVRLRRDRVRRERDRRIRTTPIRAERPVHGRASRQTPGQGLT
ncbi:hypothetical protein LP419_13285 [Massilia sp. H-1]|nr:hypothetical protein LP419_13285 [Massilia sp. H-1]